MKYIECRYIKSNEKVQDDLRYLMKYITYCYCVEKQLCHAFPAPREEILGVYEELINQSLGATFIKS